MHTLLCLHTRRLFFSRQLSAHFLGALAARCSPSATHNTAFLRVFRLHKVYKNVSNDDVFTH